MAHIRHSEVNNIIKYLDNYIDNDTSYLISMETASSGCDDTSGQHFHFAVSDFEDKYDSFRKTIFVGKYKLRGKATEGKCRQYGKIQIDNIRCAQKFFIYMCKDAKEQWETLPTIRYRNFDPREVVYFIENSYKKPTKETQDQIIMRYLDDNIDDNELFVKNYQNERRWIDENHPVINSIPVAMKVIEFYMNDCDKIISKSKVDYYIRMYIQKSTRYPKDAKIHYFMDSMRI